MKLKLDDAGHAVVQDGKPVYVHDDGKEVPFDVVATVNTISRLNGEAKGHREAKEAAEAKLKTFEGIEDAEAAKKALDTLKNIDEGKLIQAGKVEEIKAAAKKAAEEQVAAANKAAAERAEAAERKAADIEQRYNGEKVAGAFRGSKYATEKLAIPADFVQARFGGNFKVEDGKLVGYGSDGNKLFSRAKPGEIADFDEALEMLVDQYPQREHILKGTGSKGDGARSSNGTGTGGDKKITRREFEALPPATKAARVQEGYAVVD